MNDVSTVSKNIPNIAPPIVNRTLLFFYVSTWITFLVCLSIAIFDTTNLANFLFLLPASLYGILLIVLPRPRFRRGWGITMEGDLFGSRSMEITNIGHRIFFIIASCILIFWMNQYNMAFLWLYFSLLGHSIGMLKGRYSILAVGVITLLLFYDLDFFKEFEAPGIWIFILSYGYAMVFVLVLTALVNSRLQVEKTVRQLKTAKAELEASRQKDQELAVLRERDRMAREMHDVIGHALILVTLKLEAISRLQQSNLPEAQQELAATQKLVRETTAELRASLADLRRSPPADSAKSLLEILNGWATELNTTHGIITQFVFEPSVENLPLPVEETLRRVGEEALMNVVKHADARHVKLNVFCKDNQVYLSVADDGIGIPRLADGEARLEVEGHYGLRGMRERLEMVGGHLTVKPGAGGKGLLVVATVPLPVALEPAQRVERGLGLSALFGKNGKAQQS